jgi:hypothetical protein
MPRDVEEYADAKVKGVLVKLDRRFQMILSQMKHRDAGTLAQRQGTPMPPRLIELWTDCLWLKSHPRLPQEAKDAVDRFIKAKLFPRLGLYIKQMVPVEDLIREYLFDDEIEVLERRVSERGDEEEEEDQEESM